MAFRENSNQQLSFNDTLWGLTAREKKALEKSWARTFAEEIFPNIDESRFSVLYSDKASRPNTPINVIVGALVIKELFDYSDDEMVENLMLDPRLQYALHTTSYQEQPLSDKTLSRFRKRCYDYEALYNIDLYHDCIKDLSTNIRKLMQISGRIRRMDSMMIESNIRKLSRIELLYTCLSRFAMAVQQMDENFLPDSLKHYADPNDFNQVMYHQRGSEADDRLDIILKDIDQILNLCTEEYKSLQSYELLVRCLSEQTILEDGARRLRTKKDGGLDSSIMQNPSDPDATFRTKEGKEHRGYTANLEESVDSNFHKQTASFNISLKGRNRAVCQRRMKEADYADVCRLRNGVETVPSNLRRNYHLEKLPRGRIRSKFFFGSKIAALNFKKLFNYKKGKIKCAPNALFA